MIPEGTYTAKATDSALGKASTGTEQIAVSLQITSGEMQGQTVVWYGYFTERATERTLESLRHLGWTSDDITALDGLGEKEASIVIEHEPDQSGQPRVRVKWVNGLGSGIAMKERLAPNEAKALAARLKGAAIASRGGAPAPTNGRKPAPRQPAPASYAQEVGDDDIPF
jgi:hypothetical protein